MELGVVLPQTEIGSDPVALRDFAQATEALGFGHLLLYDHVLGADPDRPGGWSGPYDKDSSFHEPFVALGYLAAFTERIELVTGVIILPQRQAALVAKQAAEVDVLSKGRLRLGVGTGWNPVEYEALGENFHDRGKRQEEQIQLMRQLWREDVVTFDGRSHKVTLAGIKPRPGRDIPVWFGGGVDAVLRRAARIGDGWMPITGPESARNAVPTLRAYLRDEGRDPAAFGIQAQVPLRGGDPERWRRRAADWREVGATHLSIVTMGADLKTPDAHIDAIRSWKDAVG